MTVLPDGLLRDPARLDALQRINMMATTPSDSFDRLARLAARVMDAPMGMVNFIGAERQFFKGCFGYSSRTLPNEWGFCPVIVTTGAPLVINDAKADIRFSSNSVVTQLGVAAYAGVPLMSPDGHTLGTVCVLDYRPRAWGDADVEALLDLAGAILSEINLDIGRQDWRRLFEAFEHAPFMIALTNGADHRFTFANATHAELLGFCTFGLPAETVFPQLRAQGHLVQMDRAFIEGRPTYLYEVGVGETKTPYTFVYSPLRGASGKVEGLLHVAVDVTEQVAAREARRASERHLRDVALTLQNSLLPKKLNEPELLQVAARYLAGVEEDVSTATATPPPNTHRRVCDEASTAAEPGEVGCAETGPVDEDAPSRAAAVGGDWYDVIPLGVGRTALVIGDVMGRGVHAAAVMGQLRTAVRAYARLDLSPTMILEQLDALVQEIAPDQIVTCVYGVFDPTDQVLTFGNAGHLPPLILGPDGAVERLDQYRGTPLGVQGSAYREGRVKLSPGSLVALYTDGLVEERHRDIDEGIEELSAALSATGSSPDATCDAVLERLRIPSRQADDVALLFFRVPEPHEARTQHAVLTLDGEMLSAPAARHFAADALATWCVGEPVAGHALLAVSELVSNSLVHTHSGVELRLRRTDGQLHVDVRDDSTHLPVRCSSEPFDEGGRGLQLVAHFSKRWGARHTEAGKSVWCEFDLNPEHSLP